MQRTTLTGAITTSLRAGLHPTVTLPSDPGELSPEAEDAAEGTAEDGGGEAATSPALFEVRKLYRTSPVYVKPPRVLLAEHDDATASLITHRLTRDGIEVVRCADGEAVLDTAVQYRVGLLVLDAQVPGLSAFELLRRIRRDDRLADRPVVILSWPGNEQEAVRAFELGADDYIVKPFSPVEMAARIRRKLDLWSSPARPGGGA